MKKSIIYSIAALSLCSLFIGCSTKVPGAETTKETEAKTTTAATTAVTKEETEAADTGLSGTLSLNGSTSMEKVIKTINGAFIAENPDVTIELNLTGSGTGIKEAMAGKADIGNSSRALKDEESAELDATVIAIDGIAIIINNENTIENLELEELEKIYSGEVRNWSELGGPDKAIVVIGREDGSGTRDGFESIVMQNSEASYAQELESTGSVISTVGTTAGAIGYASLANVDESVKSLTINGVEATESTVKDGSFPIQRPFICAVKKGNDSELVKAYIDFALSQKGQECALNSGAVPVK